MGMDVRDLEVFLAVVTEGSFGRAATSLVMTQPSVSERMMRLERSVGASLFARSARGAALTSAGEELLPYASRCVALLAEAGEAVRTLEGVPRLRVAVHSTFAPRAVPLVLEAIESLPRRVTVRDAHTEDVIAMLVDGLTDVGFIVPVPVPRGLRRVALPPDPVVCVVGSSHARSRSKRMQVADLADTMIAVNPWGSGAVAFTEMLRAGGIQPWRVVEVPDARTAAVLALDDDYVSVMTRSSVERELRDNSLVPLAITDLPSWTVALELVYPMSMQSDVAIARIVELAKASSRAARGGAAWA
jgi:DNA-binding transcriptional LysR family regulator